MARFDAQASIKFIIGWSAVFLLRLVPFRPPNVEPVLATLMPLAKQYGPLGAFVFGSASIALFDVATGRFGTWTAVTALCYGLVGVGAWFFLRNRTPSVLAWVSYGVIGTLAYDLVTGVAMGPVLFGMSLRDAALGQVPFTLAHLAGTVVLSLTLSPALWRWVAANEQLQTAAVVRRLAHAVR
jgi:hypothetical protein